MGPPAFQPHPGRNKRRFRFNQGGPGSGSDFLGAGGDFSGAGFLGGSSSNAGPPKKQMPLWSRDFTENTFFDWKLRLFDKKYYTHAIFLTEASDYFQGLVTFNSRVSGGSIYSKTLKRLKKDASAGHSVAGIFKHANIVAQNAAATSATTSASSNSNHARSSNNTAEEDPNALTPDEEDHGIRGCTNLTFLLADSIAVSPQILTEAWERTLGFICFCHSSRRAGDLSSSSSTGWNRHGATTNNKFPVSSEHVVTIF